MPPAQLCKTTSREILEFTVLYTGKIPAASILFDNLLNAGKVKSIGFYILLDSDKQTMNMRILLPVE